MRLLISLLALAGCDRVLGLDRDAECVGGNGPSIVGPFSICLDTATAPAYEPRATLSTGTPGVDPGDCTTVVVQTDTLKTEVCVIAAPSITLNSPLTITGTRPLVLAATSELSILVDLDLASHGAAIAGPGAGYAGCPDIEGTGSNTNGDGSGGGAGGTFGGIGGDGGRGTVAGGTATQPVPLNVVRGGCDGGHGGSGAGSGGGGSGGRGGGALYLIAGTTLRIAATINASASAGRGGGKAGGNCDCSGGGGGGGSGGLIAMDADEVILEPSAVLLANGAGGGGGGGGGTIMTTVGSPGSEARVTDPAPFRTVGGAGGEAGGGMGGTGGDRDTPGDAGENQLVTGGGAGGGGGTGRIVVFATTLTDPGAVASPAITKP